VVHFDVPQGPSGPLSGGQGQRGSLSGGQGQRGSLSGGQGPSEPQLDAWRRSLNKLLGPAIVVRAIDVAAPGFDARRSALGRRYRYTVLNRDIPDPFMAATAWLVPEHLDVRSTQLACDPPLGEHDSSSFCRRP